MTSLFCRLWLVCLLCGANSVSAQTPEDLIQRGVALRREGKNSEALIAFRRAYEREPSPRAQAQIALAEQALAHWAAAESGLVSALAARSDAWIARNARALESALETVRDHLGSLRVEVDVAGAVVRAGGEVVGTSPLPAPLRLALGELFVEAQLPGEPARGAQITLQARTEQELTLSLRAAPAGVAFAAPAGVPQGPAPAALTSAQPAVAAEPAPPRRAADGAGRSGLRSAGIVTLASGGVLLAGGVAAHVLWQHYVHQANDTSFCDPDNYDCQDVRDAAQLAKKLMIVGYASAGIALLTGGALLIMASRSRPKRASLLLPAASAHGAGVVCYGAF
jgi:hypothetical protein